MPARHHAKPAASRSLTTSCTSGTSPSALRTRGNPNSESAARATTQDTMEPQRIRQTCSARRRRNGGSHRARARPPTSTPNTTNLLRALGPTSSRYRRSLRRLAAPKPLLVAARGRALPSLCNALTTVVLIANWAPPNSGSPSATTSKRRPSASSTKPNSNSRRKTFVVTLPPASRQILATTLSRAHPLLPKIPVRAQAAWWWPN